MKDAVALLKAHWILILVVYISTIIIVMDLDSAQLTLQSDYCQQPLLMDACIQSYRHTGNTMLYM